MSAATSTMPATVEWFNARLQHRLLLEGEGVGCFDATCHLCSTDTASTFDAMCTTGPTDTTDPAGHAKPLDARVQVSQCNVAPLEFESPLSHPADIIVFHIDIVAVARLAQLDYDAKVDWRAQFRHALDLWRPLILYVSPWIAVRGERIRNVAFPCRSSFWFGYDIKANGINSRAVHAPHLVYSVLSPRNVGVGTAGICCTSGTYGTHPFVQQAQQQRRSDADANNTYQFSLDASMVSDSIVVVYRSCGRVYSLHHNMVPLVLR